MKQTGIILVLALSAAQAAGLPPISTARMKRDIARLGEKKYLGRLSLDREADAAARMLANELRKAGVTPPAPGYLQRFPVIAWQADPARTLLAFSRAGRSQTLRFGDEFRGGFYKPVTASGRLVFAGYGITAPEYGYDDYAGIDVRGAVVIVFDHEPREKNVSSPFNGTGHTRYANRWSKAWNAARHGAVALLITPDPLRDHPSVFDPPPSNSRGGGPRRSAPLQSLDGDDIPIPALTVKPEAAARLLEPLGGLADLASAIDSALRPAPRAVPGTSVELAAAPKAVRRGESLNVVGLLEGSDPKLRDEAVLLMAHYDHLGALDGQHFPGANDNASGSAAVLELARALRRAPRPRRSLMFLIFGSEEEGMLGSYYYAAHPFRPLEATAAALNLDMIARNEAHIPQSIGVVDIKADTSNEVNLIGGMYSPDLVRVIQQANAATGLNLDSKFDRDHHMNALFRCDHIPFLMRGVPAVWFFGGWHPGYHEVSDTVEKLDLRKLEAITRLAGLAALDLANSAARPRFDANARP